MTLNIAINGFGRIGRMIFRALADSQHTDMKIVAINDLADDATLAHLLKYDSIHGRFNADVSTKDGVMLVNGERVHMSAERDPADLPWAELDIDIVMECTGFFRSTETAGKHLQAGAKRVLISAPAQGDIPTIVYGINHDTLTVDDHIVSNASCTTNALAPLAYILHKAYGLKRGMMTTIHAYTGDQPTHDSVHKDLYRGRAAALSMIPTTTGAAKAIGKVLPELNGLLDGVSIRVPTANVSAVDLTIETERPATEDEIRDLFKTAANGSLKGILAYTDEKLVSSDFNHDPHSTTFLGDQIYVNDGTMIRVMSWYDNEWGFSNRMLDTAREIGKFL
ncbi:MAG: type I glyceraldehyde-3-phosphate dehydrogenase [Robiginitomaculum sp.]|nr:MAG: type I glyceraldehyde-3-phosphate dehydrogenase [Robiginitomaculum sp.]